jgi:hypothetical protein
MILMRIGRGMVRERFSARFGLRPSDAPSVRKVTVVPVTTPQYRPGIAALMAAARVGQNCPSIRPE